MNRDLTRRVKSVSGITWSRKVMLNDLQLLRKVTEALDQRQMLWNYAPKGGATAREDDEDMAAGMMEMDTESEENKVYV